MRLINKAKQLIIPIMASRPVSVVARHITGYGIPVFLLHRLAQQGNNEGITSQHLRRCLQYLIDNDYSFISLEQYIQALLNKQALPNRAVVFTMDDGYIDQAEIIAPIFLEFGCPLTFFVITGMLDNILWPWDAQLAWIIRITNKEILDTSILGYPLKFRLDNAAVRRHARHRLLDALRVQQAEQVPAMIQQLARDAAVTLPDQAPEDFTPMNWDTARALERQGIHFAPHSVTHSTLSRVCDDTSAREILDSWKSLQTQMKNPLKLFCYPTGRAIDYSLREIMILRDNRFLGAVSSIPGFIEQYNNDKNQLLKIPRFGLPHSMEDFIQCCSWIEYAKQHFWKSITRASD
jgi:peptidoglycan/xylan/chitin deacetylase (PgdA/CDA1 family)